MGSSEDVTAWGYLSIAFLLSSACSLVFYLEACNRNRIMENIEFYLFFILVISFMLFLGTLWIYRYYYERQRRMK